MLKDSGGKKLPVFPFLNFSFFSVVDPWHLGTKPDRDPFLWPKDPDPDPAIFVLELHDANKNHFSAY